MGGELPWSRLTLRGQAQPRWPARAHEARAGCSDLAPLSGATSKSGSAWALQASVGVEPREEEGGELSAEVGQLVDALAHPPQAGIGEEVERERHVLVGVARDRRERWTCQRRGCPARGSWSRTRRTCRPWPWWAPRSKARTSRRGVSPHEAVHELDDLARSPDELPLNRGHEVLVPVDGEQDFFDALRGLKRHGVPHVLFDVLGLDSSSTLPKQHATVTPGRAGNRRAERQPSPAPLRLPMHDRRCGRPAPRCGFQRSRRSWRWSR